MTRSFSVAAAALTLLGCSDPSAPVRPPLEPAHSVTQFMERIQIEETDVFPVPRGCTGEPIEWTLRQEIINRSTIDAQGGFHGSFLFHDKGSSGVGLITGAQYRLAQVQDENFETAADELPTNDTAVFLRRFISQGSLSNFRVTNLFHFTIDANGNLTSYHNTFDRVCD